MSYTHVLKLLCCDAGVFRGSECYPCDNHLLQTSTKRSKNLLCHTPVEVNPEVPVTLDPVIVDQSGATVATPLSQRTVCEQIAVTSALVPD